MEGQEQDLNDVIDAEIVDESQANEDRGDDFTPTADDEGAKKSEPDADLELPASEGEETPAAELEDNKGDLIPKARFNEVNAKRREAEQENERLQAELAALKAQPATPTTPAAPQKTVRELSAAAYEALLEGNTDLAAELDEQAKIMAARQAIAENNALSARQQAEREAQAAASAVGAAALDIKTRYPQLDTTHADHNEFAVDAVHSKYNKLVADGVPAGQALADAAEYVAEKLGFSSATTNTQTPAAKNRHVAANAKAAAQQPPSVALAGEGERGRTMTAAAIESMTDAQLEAMPEAERKRLRGD